MAARNLSYHHHHHTPQFLYLEQPPVADQTTGGGCSGGGFEMDESDIWNTSNDHGHDHDQPDKSRKVGSRKPLKAHQQRKLQQPMTGKSLPVNVPDWSKILRDEYKHRGRDNGYEFDDDDDGGGGDVGGGVEWLPPHEYLARTRVASFSVHEGIGRTLKGRDLSRVRNAIWKQTGFGED